MKRTDRILLALMVAALYTRVALALPLNGALAVIVAFAFAFAAVVFALRKDGNL